MAACNLKYKQINRHKLIQAFEGGREEGGEGEGRERGGREEMNGTYMCRLNLTNHMGELQTDDGMINQSLPKGRSFVSVSNKKSILIFKSRFVFVV